MKHQNPKNVKTQQGYSLLFNLSSVLAENRKLREELYDTTTKKHQEMSRAIELYEKNSKLRRQLQAAEDEAYCLRGSINKLQNCSVETTKIMSCAYDEIKAMHRDNELLRYEIMLSKLKRTEASNNAERIAEENYYLEKNLAELREEVYKLKCEHKALSSRRLPNTNPHSTLTVGPTFLGMILLFETNAQAVSVVGYLKFLDAGNTGAIQKLKARLNNVAKQKPDRQCHET